MVAVCAPPELRTTTGGLVLPGADTVVEVSDPAVVDVSSAEVCAVAVVCAVVEVCAPPELLTTTVGPAPVVAVVVPEVGDSPLLAVVLRWLACAD